MEAQVDLTPFYVVLAIVIILLIVFAIWKVIKKLTG